MPMPAAQAVAALAQMLRSHAATSTPGLRMDGDLGSEASLGARILTGLREGRNH